MISLLDLSLLMLLLPYSHNQITHKVKQGLLEKNKQLHLPGSRGFPGVGLVRRSQGVALYSGRRGPPMF